MYPASYFEVVPIHIIHNIVFVEVHVYHKMTGTPGFVLVFFCRKVGVDLQVGFPIVAGIHPIDDNIRMAAIIPVIVNICHYTIIVGVALKVGRFHVIIVVNPLHSKPIRSGVFHQVGVSIVVQIGKLRFCSWQRL